MTSILKFGLLEGREGIPRTLLGMTGQALLGGGEKVGQETEGSQEAMVGQRVSRKRV